MSFRFGGINTSFHSAGQYSRFLFNCISLQQNPIVRWADAAEEEEALPGGKNSGHQKRETLREVSENMFPSFKLFRQVRGVSRIWIMVTAQQLKHFLKKVFKQTINVIMSTMDKELVEVVPGIVPVRPVVTATWLALEVGLRPTSSVQKRRKTASCGQYQATDAGRQKTQPDLTAQTAHWISANRDTFSPGSTETTVTETSLRLQQISAHLLGLIKRFKVFWGVNTLSKMSE